MNLHPVKHDLKTKLWCGPAALSILTGLPTSVCHAQLRNYFKTVGYGVEGVPRRIIKGIYTSEALAVLAVCGLNYECVHDFKTDGEPMFLKWYLRNKSAFTPDDTLLVLVKGHFVILRNGRIYDNFNRSGSDGHPFAWARPLVLAYSVSPPSDF